MNDEILDSLSRPCNRLIYNKIQLEKQKYIIQEQYFKTLFLI